MYCSVPCYIFCIFIPFSLLSLKPLLFHTYHSLVPFSSLSLLPKALEISSPEAPWSTNFLSFFFYPLVKNYGSHSINSLDQLIPSTPCKEKMNLDWTTFLISSSKIVLEVSALWSFTRMFIFSLVFKSTYWLFFLFRFTEITFDLIIKHRDLHIVDIQLKFINFVWHMEANVCQLGILLKNSSIFIKLAQKFLISVFENSLWMDESTCFLSPGQPTVIGVMESVISLGYLPVWYK